MTATLHRKDSYDFIYLCFICVERNGWRYVSKYENVCGLSAFVEQQIQEKISGMFCRTCEIVIANNMTLTCSCAKKKICFDDILMDIYIQAQRLHAAAWIVHCKQVNP